MTAAFQEIALLLAAPARWRWPPGWGKSFSTTVGYFIAIALAMTPWQEPSA